MPQKLTREQAAIIGAYTGYLCGPFDDLRQYAERKLGRPVDASDLPLVMHLAQGDPLVCELKDAARSDFNALAAVKEE